MDRRSVLKGLGALAALPFGCLGLKGRGQEAGRVVEFRRRGKPAEIIRAPGGCEGVYINMDGAAAGFEVCLISNDSDRVVRLLWGPERRAGSLGHIEIQRLEQFLDS